MSTSSKKNRKRTLYEKHFDKPKKMMLWIPPSVEQAYIDDPYSQNIMYIVYLIESYQVNGVKMVERIDTSLYDGSFQNFYETHLNQYTTSETNFCSKYSEGGVSPDYIVNSADCEYEDDNITLLSVDTDEYGNIIDVYALITFHLVDHEPETIMVETLCGNRTLEPSGEGTRLINFLKMKAQEAGFNKIVLHPLDTVIGYYTRLNFRKLNSDEADAINLSNYEDDETTMATNMRALNHWKKLKTTSKVIGKFMINKKLKDANKTRKVIKEIYIPTYDEKTGKRGTPIHTPFSKPTTHFVPRPAKIGKVINVKMGKDGTVEVSKLAKQIIPGASMQLIKERDAVKNSALMTQTINRNAKKETLNPIKEESPIQELSQSQIDEDANKIIQEEKKNALNIFENAKFKSDKIKKAKGTRKRKRRT